MQFVHYNPFDLSTRIYRLTSSLIPFTRYIAAAVNLQEPADMERVLNGACGTTPRIPLLVSTRTSLPSSLPPLPPPSLPSLSISSRRSFPHSCMLRQASLLLFISLRLVLSPSILSKTSIALFSCPSLYFLYYGNHNICWTFSILYMIQSSQLSKVINGPK